MKTPVSMRAAWLVCAACALAGLPLQAQAAVVVQDLNFGFGPLAAWDGNGPWVADAAQTQVFQQFDPSLGTLTAARWELRSAWVAFGSASVESLHTDPGAPATGTFGIAIGLDTRVNFGGSLLGTGGQYFSHGHQTSQGCTTTAALGPCQIELEFGATFDGVIDVIDLAALTGGGDFVQGVEAALQLGNAADSGVAMDAWAQLIWADRADRGDVGQLRLVYEFDAFGPPGSVPEPSSLALAGLALAALQRGRWRRRPRES